MVTLPTRWQWIMIVALTGLFTFGAAGESFYSPLYSIVLFALAVGITVVGNTAAGVVRRFLGRAQADS